MSRRYRQPTNAGEPTPPYARPAGAAPQGESALALPGLSRRGAFGLLVLVGGLLVLMPVISAEMWGPDLSGTDPIDISVLALSKWIQLAFAALVAALLLRSRGWSPAAFGLHWPGAGPVVGWGCATLAGLYGILLASAIVLLVLAMLVAPPARDAMMSDAQARADLLGRLDMDDLRMRTMLLLGVALQEEILFRGLLLPLIWRLTNMRWAAVVGSALVFGALHGAQGALGILQATFLGLVLGVAFVACRNVWAVTLAHFIFNWLQFVLIGMVSPFIENSAPPPGMGG